MSRIVIVSGPPCSGKTTYVSDHIGQNDICFDMDRYAIAACWAEPHADHTDAQYRILFRLRACLLEICREDKSEIDACYIIATRVTDHIREAAGDGAEYVEIDATEDECLERLENDDTRKDKEKEREKIHKYFHPDKEEEKRSMTPTEKIKLKNTAQARALSIMQPSEGKRLDSDHYVEGYAARWETYLLYDDGDWGKVYERFERGCFEGCDMSDIIMQYDHEGRVFARNTNGTLLVEPTDEGLFMAADLSRTEGARSLYEDISVGLITKMSWRFMPDKYVIERTEGSKDVTIVHTKIKKVYDVSAVSIPANNDTEINARSWCDGVIAAAARSEAELDDKRKRLKIKIKIMEANHEQTE